MIDPRCDCIGVGVTQYHVFPDHVNMRQKTAPTVST